MFLSILTKCMSCFCCPCRFESRKNPHFGVQKGAKYELYINIDGIFRVAHRFGFFVKMPAPGTFLCFTSVIFPRRFVVMPCSPCLSTVIPASSVKCIAFSRLAPGSPRAVFFHASSFFAFSRLPASPLGRSSPPLWRSLSPAPGVPVCCSVVGRVPPPLGRSLSPAPGVPGFCSVVGRVPPPLGRSLSPAPGVPGFCSVVGRVPPPLGRSLSPAPGVPGFCSVVGRVSSPPLGRFQPCAADGFPSGNKRARVLPGSGKHTESGGSSFVSFRRF